jgi:hypothetical protein
MVKVKVRVSLRLELYCQSIHLGVKPLETHYQRREEKRREEKRREEKMRVSLMNKLGLLSSVRIAHMYCMLLKILPL